MIDLYSLRRIWNSCNDIKVKITYSFLQWHVGLYGSGLFNFGYYVSIPILFACFLVYILSKMFFIILVYTIILKHIIFIVTFVAFFCAFYCVIQLWCYRGYKIFDFNVIASTAWPLLVFSFVHSIMIYGIKAVELC